MGMKQRSGTKSKTMEGMLNVFQSTFSRSGMKQCLEFALAKVRGLCKYSADAYNSNSHLWAPLSYFCLRKQSKKINAMRRVVFPKELSVISHEIWRSLLANWICYIAAKNHDLFVTEEWKRELEKQGKCGHRLIVHSITRKGEIWGGGVKWRDSGRGRRWTAPLCQLISEPGEMVWQYIYFSTLIKKGTFTYSDSNPRDSRNQNMWRWYSQIASDYMKSCINPLRLVSAPPPPLTSSAPSFSGFGP